MGLPRDQALTTWVQQQLNDTELTIHVLPGDASFRRYARIQSKTTTCMLMDAPPDQEDSRPFVAIGQWLNSHGVRVPHIIAQDLAQGFILLEDFGNTLLAQVLNDETADRYYRQAMDQLLQLQQLPTNDPAQQLPAYDFDRLMQEMALFDQWFVEKYLNIQLTSDEQQLLRQTYTLLANSALAQPQVVVHRDYHSRNLMVLQNQTNPQDKTLGVIDFQDAVTGAYTYDLISILRDAYVQWPASRVQQWMQYFWQHLPASQTAARNLNDFAREFDFMAAQRHLKVLGIFIRLNLRDGKTGYMKDLALVLHYLLQEIRNYPELQAFEGWLRQRILPAFLQQQPESQPRIEGLVEGLVP